MVDSAREFGVVTLLDEGRGVCNAVYVDDACDAIRRAIDMEQGISSAFLVTGARAVTWREFNVAFAQMVAPAARIVSVSCDEMRRHWPAQEPTL